MCFWRSRLSWSLPLKLCLRCYNHTPRIPVTTPFKQISIIIVFIHQFQPPQQLRIVIWLFSLTVFSTFCRKLLQVLKFLFLSTPAVSKFFDIEYLTVEKSYAKNNSKSYTMSFRWTWVKLSWVDAAVGLLSMHLGQYSHWETAHLLKCWNYLVCLIKAVTLPIFVESYLARQSKSVSRGTCVAQM